MVASKGGNRMAAVGGTVSRCPFSSRPGSDQVVAGQGGDEVHSPAVHPLARAGYAGLLQKPGQHLGGRFLAFRRVARLGDEGLGERR